MNRWGRTVRVILVLGILIFSAFAVVEGRAESQRPREIKVVFTHDLHSYLEPVKVRTPDGDVVEEGGFARLAGFIKKVREENPGQVLVLDAGDFSMGTLVHTLFTREAAELRLLEKMGYDATTIGNHELDFDSDGLAAMLKSAREKGVKMPVVAANISLKKDMVGAIKLNNAFIDYPVRQYLVVERNGLRIGIFGLLGKDAAHDLIWGQDILLKDPVKTAQGIVKKLREREKVDVVICLSHAGTSAVKDNSEDEILAEEVPGIDVIISGHSHTILTAPIRKGNTVIASAGCYGARAGVLTLRCATGQRPELVSYRLQAIDASVPADPDITRMVEAFKNAVERDFLAGIKCRYDQVIAESDYDLEDLDTAARNREESGLGDLIADAFRDAVLRAEGENSEYLHAAVVPLGEIRGSFLAGLIRVSDVFRVLSLGMGPDRTPGYPLVSFYLNGKEIKNCLETQSTVAALKPDYNLQVSGVRFRYNPHRVPFDRVYSVEISSPGGGYEPLREDRLYRVCTSYMTAVMLGKMGSITFGIISVVPKDRSGRPLTDIRNALIDADPQQLWVQELKEWRCLMDYLGRQPDTDGDGIPNLPAGYREPAGRYQAVASWQPADLFREASAITWGFLAASLVVLALLVLIIRAMLRRAAGAAARKAEEPDKNTDTRM